MVSSVLLIAAAAFLVASSLDAVPVHAVPAATLSSYHGGGGFSHFFAFGDSLIDTGNFLHYSTAPGPVAHSPYGEAFFHRPTGRWSDGCLIVDFIVERLGLPHWPAYLEAKSKEDFRYGANFAVASGTALDQLLFKKQGLNVNSITPYSLAVQIGWFNEVLAKLASTDDDGLEREEMMSRWRLGSNDYIHPLFQNKTVEWVKPLVPLVIASIGSALESLIQLGAKTVYVAVAGVIPLGCSRPAPPLPLPQREQRRRLRRPGHRLPPVAQRPRGPPQRAPPSEARPAPPRHRRCLARLRRLLRQDHGRRPSPPRCGTASRPHCPRRVLRRRRALQCQLHRPLLRPRRRASCALTPPSTACLDWRD